jgi:hypothetical protein
MPTVDQVMLKVQRLLTGPMNLRIDLHGEVIGVRFSDSSTQVHVRVLDWGTTKEGEPRTVVRVSSPILRGVTPTPALYEYICREAPRVHFGSLAVWDDTEDQGKITLSLGHTLLGDYLDEEELRAVLYGVLGLADELDDTLQKRFGGKRWTDA